MSLVLVALAGVGVALALAGSGSASAPITKTQAVAFALAVNLTASDLPGGKKVEPPPNERQTHTTLLKVVRCANPAIVNHRPIDEDASTFEYARSIVASLVRVMPSEAIAAAELSAFASMRGHVCFARAAQVEVTSEDEPREASNQIKATFIPLVTLLGTGAIGVHTLSKLPHARGSQVIHTDGVLFRVGPAEILFITVGRTPFPAATEGRLLSLLHNRAEAHKL